MMQWSRLAARAGALTLFLAMAAPAALADVFAWRTDDGVFAYTDDPERIPARYAERAVAVPDTRLETYPRLTIEDSAATSAVVAHNQERLDYLRRLNTPAVEAPATRGAARSGGTATVTVATGNPRVPTIDVAAGADAAPIVVEPVLSRRSDEVRTRRTTLVKQGDRTLAIVKGRSHHIDVNEDIYDEEELEAAGR